MKKKLLYIIFIAICIVDIVITFAKGLNVGLYYGEGYTITFSENDINVDDVKSIAKDVFGKEYVVQQVEFFNDSCMIKVRDVSDEQIASLISKLNEKYSSELTTDDIKLNHIANVRIRSLIEPYVIPVILSTLIVLAYYAVRFRGAKQMLELLRALVIVGVAVYSVYAICRIPVNVLTTPIMMTAYILTILFYTIYAEKQKVENN